MQVNRTLFSERRQQCLSRMFIRMHIVFKMYLPAFFSLVFSSIELAKSELLGYHDVRHLSYLWTSVTSETSKTYVTSIRQLVYTLEGTVLIQSS